MLRVPGAESGRGRAVSWGLVTRTRRSEEGSPKRRQSGALSGTVTGGGERLR